MKSKAALDFLVKLEEKEDTIKITKKQKSEMNKNLNWLKRLSKVFRF